MNVTNRRKSTEADTTPTTQTSSHHHHQQHLPQQHLSHQLHQLQPHLPYVSCRQAATTATLQQQRHHQQAPASRHELDAEEEQESVVTSTSSDCLLPLPEAEGEGEEICIDLDSTANVSPALLTTSPARITSSTNNYDILRSSYSSSSHSLSLEEEMVMPTTSENAARIEREELSILPTHKHSLRSNSNLANNSRSTMVARDTTHTSVADASELRPADVIIRDSNDLQATASTSTSNNSDSPKIILKLPKPSAANESQLLNSESADDPRKVEPLKINLHNTHHHHNTHHTPKITIKPILKESINTDASLVSSEECSSSAEDDIVSKLSNSEPHIVPKLTIRAKNEDYDSSHTTVVPKLTIKINDSNADGLSKSSTAALNTPPLPKLTIKTGQDGHTESIITNVSPASSTNSSSSSLASTSGASLSSANSVMVGTNASNTATVPKLTIKPIQKSKDFMEHQQQQLPAIPKLCIKTNTLSTDEPEEATSSKIPKLTIKTGQEHAVIITQHSDNNKNSGAIPKLTIKTKSLDVTDEATSTLETSMGDKIPKLTIKTNNANESIPKLCINKAQLEAVAASSSSAIGPLLSPKQLQPVVPKLTISRQTVQNEKIVTEGVNSQCAIPKMTIKTQMSSKNECVPKLTVKTVNKQRISPTEGNKISDDTEEDHIKIVETNKTVPKLTIKNIGSPQQKLKVVVDTQSAEELQKETEEIMETKEELQLISANEDVDDFNDLLSVDNVGGESSNSQGFCGFNENLDAAEEYRRHSDDMDIDDALNNQHEPQMFQNASHFKNQIMSAPLLIADSEQNGNNVLNNFPKLAQIIDTVDLTSSAGSSPAHRFEYNEDEDEELEECAEKPEETILNHPASTNSQILLECLQRETSVIQNAQCVIAHAAESNAIPPPLLAKPPIPLNNTSTSSRYPELMERLMTNGLVTGNNNNIAATTKPAVNEENIIDSIEILDTPEGSPRTTLDERPDEIKSIGNEKPHIPNGLHSAKEILEALNKSFNNNFKRHLPQTQNNSLHVINDITTPNASDNLEEELPTKLRKIQNDSNEESTTTTDNTNNNKVVAEVNIDEQIIQKQTEAAVVNNSIQHNQQTNHQRSRKQKHEHLLPLPMDEVVDSMQSNSLQHLTEMCNSTSSSSIGNVATGIATAPVVLPVKKKLGRPRKSEVTSTPPTKAKEDINDNKTRRVQLLRKRLAIDMVDADQPLTAINSLVEVGDKLLIEPDKNEEHETIETVLRRERNLRTPLRTSRRSNTPTTPNTEKQLSMKNKAGTAISYLAMENNKKALKSDTVFNNFLASNNVNVSSELVSKHAASVTATITTDVVGGVISTENSSALSMAAQIDLTMSSSSSNSNGSTTNTITTVEAMACSNSITRLGGTNGPGIVSISGGGSSNNSMLPPTTILSSSDPIQDVVFRPNDFSSIIATQQLRGSITRVVNAMHSLDQPFEQEMQGDVSGADCSEDDSASSSSLSTTPVRSGRGRGRGSRGGKSATGRAYKAHRLGRSASAVAKAIAVNRPKWVGTLKHTPDPERIKGLFSPSPQVFEEDTRMSADLTQTPSMQQELLPAPMRQPDFLNNEESQSSVISSGSILDPNNVVAIQNGSAVKKPVRKKKMEVCVSEDADFSVGSIAEYEWPRPKGCCPSKNRDTFMIQEQVANYLGIKSFKRKYPDLPRRQVDMEERNWLQEQGLVSEKMCDLGITAVWASDILDIMYSDFYEKYEEYKDFVRQKHLREIEAKQKSLGLNVAGRGLQARDRAMLNTSKWNAYFNKTRKDERTSCLDLQTLIVNKPSPAAAAISNIPNRPVAEAVALAAKVENIPEPPTLLKPHLWDVIRYRDAYYPLSLVPGQFCEKYHEYTTEELSRFPLNTVLVHHQNIWPRPEDETHSSDTDSAVESIENDLEPDATLRSRSKLLRRKRERRQRNKQIANNDDEFKIPPLPAGASASTTSSTDSSSTSSSSSDDDDASSDSDSNATCSSASSEESSEDENSPATCGVCLHPQNRNLKNIPELFIQCYTCRRKVHPSCIEMPHRMTIRVRNYNWQCAECKCCVKCKGRKDQNKMLFCEQCDRGFHVYCLDVKSVPDGRWSCDRCSICMRCGATKSEGLPFVAAQQAALNKQTRQRKLKWVNEYRVDHITKIKEHCSMLCVPCGRPRTIKRVQIATHNNTTATFSIINSPGSSGALSPNCSSGQCSPAPAPSNITINAPNNGTIPPLSTDSSAATYDTLHLSGPSEKLTTAIPASSPATSLSSCTSSTAMSTDLSATMPAAPTDSMATKSASTSSFSSSTFTSSSTSGVTPPVVA